MVQDQGMLVQLIRAMMSELHEIWMVEEKHSYDQRSRLVIVPRDSP